MASSPVTDIGSLLVVDPGLRRGRPCLRGTRITVHNVAAAAISGATVDDMVRLNPDLNPALFHAALAYYHANKQSVDKDLATDARQGAKLAASQGDGASSMLDDHS